MFSICTECANSKQCHSVKHHYDECVERVTNASDDDAEGEDCVEECKLCPHPFSSPFLALPPLAFPFIIIREERKTLYMLLSVRPSQPG